MPRLMYKMPSEVSVYRLVMELKRAGFREVAHPPGRSGVPHLVAFEVEEEGESYADAFVRKHQPDARRLP